ncbi:arginine N-methyltransferase [Thraustotheca clavata]|uniref:Protein arginine N-methyltransferase n=1 Tax=Thraustotheca clavata TaxID=74557 RepID=A0A1W0A0B2_9STRA|nr:arginine N-methyltransferase [Thraustotheca clavata]
MTSNLIVGLETTFCQDLPSKLDKLYEERISCIVAPLFHPRFRRDANVISDNRDGPETRSDLVLDSRGWTSSVVGLLSTWVDFDSSCELIRLTAEKVFKQEIAWASHLSLAAVMTPSLHATRSNANYARLLNQAATQAQYTQFWVKVPLYYPGKFDEDDPSFVETWEGWNSLRSMCEYNSKIYVALEITADLPDKRILDRWLGEPIAAVIIPTEIFLTNKKGYPTLSKMHQKFFLQLFQHKIRYFIKGRPYHHGRYLPYVQYLEHLWSTRSSCSDAKADFEAPYLDYLQAPLQPLMDNLESQTYETFEQDPVKYQQYEIAITQALADTPKDKVSIVMVVGAGRGPLVRCSLRAAEKAQRTIKMYAVEKNPNAVITLRNMKISEKWDNVKIIASDMRVWKAPEKADIMVSELLGSFGDNELSPECLDGAQAFLHENGISIPCRYTSFVAPISSSKLWNEVKSLKSVQSTHLKNFETPYVVRLHQIYSFARPQPCFTFDHPNRDTIIDNRRFHQLSFEVQENGVLHGLAGYFDSVLYGDTCISINPETLDLSPGMFSWFPIFFPLRTPLQVREGDLIDVCFWRQVGGGKVWYEWTVGINNTNWSPIHNPNGRSYWIGL